VGNARLVEISVDLLGDPLDLRIVGAQSPDEKLFGDSGMVAIRAPALQALRRAAVWVTLMIVGATMTSDFAMASATSGGGSRR